MAKGGVSLRLATLAGLSYRQHRDLLVNTMCLKAFVRQIRAVVWTEFSTMLHFCQDAARAFVYALEHYELFAGQAFNW